MADDFDNVFDPSMKKKKKKVKKIVDLDGQEEAAEPAKSEEPQISENTNKENEAVQESQGQDNDDDMNFDDFTSMKMKKKKKKKKGFEDGQEDTEGTEKEPVENGVENGTRDDQVDQSTNETFAGKKKKKKRPTKENEMVKQVEEENKGTEPDYADREYTYEELLTRVFKTMKDKNPDAVAGEKRKFIMRPPQVFKIGTKKTSFANFGDICKILHRQPKHLLAYLLAELGTSGSIDSNNQLIIKGRFQQKQIESVLRRYIKEYVTCHTCRAPETILQKETRLYFLQCETCGSRCSVASIKSGYQAVTGRRAALKSKQQ